VDEIETKPTPQSLPSGAIRVWLGAALAGLLLYGLTMAPGLVWQDSGDAQVRVALDDWRGPFDLARSHTLYFMLASGIRHGFGTDPAWAANLVSVIGGAITVANLAALLFLVLRNRVAVLATVIMMALSHTLWQFSTMAETYSLVAAFLTGELLALVAFSRTRHGRWIQLLGLLNGFAAANHNLALISTVCFVGVAAITIPQWQARYRRDVLIAGLLWLIGFAPMLAMMIGDLRSGSDIFTVFHSLLVGRNAEQVFNTSFGLGDLARFAGMIALNFPTPLILFALLGWAGLRGRIDPRVRLTFVLLLAAHVVFVVRYNIVDQFSFMIPTCVMLAVFAGAGIDRALDRLADRRSRIVSALVVLLALPAPAFYAALPVILRRLPPERVPIPLHPIPYRDPYEWFLHPWHAGYVGAECFATEALAVFPPDALALSDTTMRSPILYLQNHKGMRRDVRIGFGTMQPFLEFKKIVGDDLRPFIEQGRLYSLAGDARNMGGNRWIAVEYQLVPAGPVFKIVPRSPP